MTEWSAWYGGDPDRLRDVYGGVPAGGRIRWFRFWTRIAKNPEAQKAELHVPIAGDLAAVSGALLFGEEPRIFFKEAQGADAGDPEKAADARLQEMIMDGGAYNRLVEAAETAAAMGGVYLYPGWDTAVAQVPVINVIQADQAVPEFTMGLLKSVVFWREVDKVDNGASERSIVRHLEEHSVEFGRAQITHALFIGDARHIGTRLSENAVRSNLGLEPLIQLPFAELDVQYVPNMRPNRLWRKSGLGLSDYSGNEGIFDALDEVYASWMRDIRLAKARIIVPKEFLDENGTMDIDWEVYQPMDMDPNTMDQGTRAMLAQQFEIRHAEHLATAAELVERAVSNAGYSPGTFGIKSPQRADSSPALRFREAKTVLTVKRKANWWGPALKRLFYHMALIDEWQFAGPGGKGLTIVTEMNDGIPSDPMELAQTANTLSAAKAASIESRVRLVNPHAEEVWVQAEVLRIKDEEKAAAPAMGRFAPGPPDSEGSADVPNPEGSQEGDAATLPSEIEEAIE